MLRLTMAVGEDCLIASLRGPNQPYLSGNPATDEIAYNWGTRPHPDVNIPLHHRIVKAVRRLSFAAFQSRPRGRS